MLAEKHHEDRKQLECVIADLTNELREKQARIEKLEAFVGYVRIVTNRLPMPTEQEVMTIDKVASELQGKD